MHKIGDLVYSIFGLGIIKKVKYDGHVNLYRYDIYWFDRDETHKDYNDISIDTFKKKLDEMMSREQ